MSDDAPASPPPPPPSPYAAPQVARRRDWLPSLIWLIPLIAALVGITLVVKILVSRGPEVVLSFKTAEGLDAGKTVVRYKNVQIGIVENLRLSQDRSHVRVVVRLNKDAATFAARDTRYWVVRPRFDTSGVSGLGTVLSGAYIGADPGVEEDHATDFVGLESPPIVTRDASGRQFTLHADDIGSLDVGSPVYYRRVKVGQVAAYELDPDGRAVTLRVFVNAPYDKLVGRNTRFWHASGLDVQLNSGGVTLRTQSLATILLGGIAFLSPDDGAGPLAAENTEFALADDEAQAMKVPDGPAQATLLYFNQSLRGLAPGAPVDFRGVVIGEVKSIGVEFDRGERQFRMPVLVQVYPDRLSRRTVDGRPAAGPPSLKQLQFLVERGLRAQLRTGNLLTGQVFVALDFFPKSPPVKFDPTHTPFELPTVSSGLDELQSQVQEVIAKVNKVPFEQIGSDLHTTLASLDRTLSGAEQLIRTLNNDVSPEITAAVKDARKTLTSAERTLNTADKTLSSADRTLSSDAPIQQDLRKMLQELSRTAASVRVLTDYLERHPESLLRGKPDDKK